MSPSVASGEDGLHVQNDLRPQIAKRLLDRRDSLAADSVGIFQVSGPDSLDDDYCRRIADLLVELLATAVREGRVAAHSGLIVDLQRLVLDRSLSAERLFTFAYLIERAALDELALDDGFGATTEPWATVAQLIRRASFDLLAAYTERVQGEQAGANIIDHLTTLYTWPMFQAVLAKELERANRFGDPISLILFDIDNLSEINHKHGYGVGDLILERAGILIRKYFRQHDWVARHHEDSFAVLLVRTDGDAATTLVEHVRKMIAERLEIHDHHTDQPLHVTVSVAAVNVAAPNSVPNGAAFDPERLVADAVAALARAKLRGRNCVERVDVRATPGEGV